jgi:hypothetical protein
MEVLTGLKHNQALLKMAIEMTKQYGIIPWEMLN